MSVFTDAIALVWYEAGVKDKADGRTEGPTEEFFVSEFPEEIAKISFESYYKGFNGE